MLNRFPKHRFWNYPFLFRRLFSLKPVTECRYIRSRSYQIAGRSRSLQPHNNVDSVRFIHSLLIPCSLVPIFFLDTERDLVSSETIRNHFGAYHKVVSAESFVRGTFVVRGMIVLVGPVIFIEWRISTQFFGRCFWMQFYSSSNYLFSAFNW